MNSPETSKISPISPDQEALSRDDIYDLVIAISVSFRRIDEGAESDDEVIRQRSVMANANISGLLLAILYGFSKDPSIDIDVNGEANPNTADLLQGLSDASKKIATKIENYEDITATNEELKLQKSSSPKEIIEKCAIRSTVQADYEKAQELFEEYRQQAEAAIDLTLLLIAQNEDLKTNSMFERIIPVLRSY